MARGTCTVHSFNSSLEDEGDPLQGKSVDEELMSDEETYYSSTYRGP